jgi:hypothetical protein
MIGFLFVPLKGEEFVEGIPSGTASLRAAASLLLDRRKRQSAEELADVHCAPRAILHDQLLLVLIKVDKQPLFILVFRPPAGG